ncbi:hypothetical protein PG994_005296 [Apiospora phragmitis]|uniref:DUF6546 domain-containing protein n=1 Tax=Apiospora phragmitis TaxID=2905665 RepID=A0ABR1VBU8_9PEZI
MATRRAKSLTVKSRHGGGQQQATGGNFAWSSTLPPEMCTMILREITLEKIPSGRTSAKNGNFKTSGDFEVERALLSRNRHLEHLSVSFLVATEEFVIALDWPWKWLRLRCLTLTLPLLAYPSKPLHLELDPDVDKDWQKNVVSDSCQLSVESERIEGPIHSRGDAVYRLRFAQPSHRISIAVGVPHRRDGTNYGLSSGFVFRIAHYVLG